MVATSAWKHWVAWISSVHVPWSLPCAVVTGSVASTPEFGLSGVTNTAESPKKVKNIAKNKKNQNGTRTSLFRPGGAV